MKFRPLHDRILVKRLDSEAKTKGGIIIPDTAKEKPQEALVVAVGPGRVNDEGKVTPLDVKKGVVVAAGPGKAGDDGKIRPLDVKKGDKVLFGKYSGSEVTLDGEEHLIIREDDVLAVLE
jgi:chaperonin GroES